MNYLLNDIIIIYIYCCINIAFLNKCIEYYFVTRKILIIKIQSTDLMEKKS